MLKTMALCMSRSKMAAATTLSPMIWPHAGKPLLVVTRVGWPYSARVLTTCKITEVPSVPPIGRRPTSSITSTVGAV